MKTTKIFLILIFIQLSVKAQKYSIVCTADGTSNLSKGVLIVNNHNDTLNFNNGKLVFNGTVDEPTRGILLIDYKGSGFFGHYYNILLTQGSTQFSISDPNQRDSTEVKGNPLAADFEYKLYRPVMYFNNAAEIEFGKYSKAKADNSVDTVRYLKNRDQAVFKCFQVPQTYIKTNPNSPVSIIALEMMGNGGGVSGVTFQTLKDLFAQISRSVRETKAGRKYEAFLATLH